MAKKLGRLVRERKDREDEDGDSCKNLGVEKTDSLQTELLKKEIKKAEGTYGCQRRGAKRRA